LLHTPINVKEKGMDIYGYKFPQMDSSDLSIQIDDENHYVAFLEKVI
jgi:hypothetical protein